MDAKIVHIVEKEVPEFSVGGDSAVETDSSFRQVGNGEYKTKVACESPPLPVKSFIEGVDQRLESELVADRLKHRSRDDVCGVDANIEDFQEMQELAAKSVPTVETEVPVVSYESSSGAHLNAGPRQNEDGDHASCEQLSLSAKSFVHGAEYESGTSLIDHLEQGTTVDIHVVDSEMEDVKEAPGQAVDSVAVELPTEQKINQKLVSEKIDAKVISNVENKSPNVSFGGSSDLNSVSRQVGVREYGHLAVYEQPSLPVKSSDKVVDHGPEYDSGHFVAEHMEHRTGDFHEVDLEMVDVREMEEQAANTELPKEKVGQVSNKLDAKVAFMRKEVPDASVKGSLDSDSGPRPAEERNNGDKSIVKGVLHVPGYEVTDSLKLRATSDIHKFDRDRENAKEIVEQAASTEAFVFPVKQKVDQELVYSKMDANIAYIRKTEVPSDSVRGSPVVDLDSGLAQVGDRECRNQAAYEQPSLTAKSLSEDIDSGLEYVASSLVDEDLEHGVMSEVHDVDTNMDDIQEKQEQAVNMSNTEAIELPEEQVVDVELVSGKTEVPDVFTGGSPGVYIDSSPSQIGDGEYGDHAPCDEAPSPVRSLSNVVDQELEYEPGTTVAENLEHSASNDVHEVDTNMDDAQAVKEGVASNEAVKSLEEKGEHELVPHSAKPRSKEEKNVKRASSKLGSLMKDHRVTYQLPSENESEFAVFDLVWGKVKSHPWWPGQIFHPSDSSEKAMKYYRKDCYLVAYFGDRTFAWNEASVLKPFRIHFPLAERQNNSEAFQNAVSCALEEVTRRVELGLACSCLCEEAYDKIKYQLVENTGIREESSRREGIDRFTSVDSFQPDKFTKYVRSLALFPNSGADRLELSIAKAQLCAFNRLKGWYELPEYQYYEGLVECDVDTPIGDQGLLAENEHTDSVAGVDAKKGFHKRKHNLKDIVYQRRKEKSVTELMSEYYLDGEFDSHEEDDINLTTHSVGTKRKASGFLSDDFPAQKSIKSISLAKVSHSASPNPLQSFKVGECIRRVASQLTGSSQIIKGCIEGSNNIHSGDNADEVSDPPDVALIEDTLTPSKESSLDEMLSQLHLSARNPMKGYSFVGGIISFFSEFRNLAVTTQRQILRKGSSRRRKSSAPIVGSPETFEFDDRNDSYWTDMVVQNSAEAKPARRGRKKKDEQAVSGDPEKPLRPNPRKYSRKQYHLETHDSAPEMPAVDKKQLDLPTELMLNFGEMNSVLSEVNLNKIFRRFGPLKESETEVDMQGNRARVVFKKRSDAEVAYSSAATFHIFGSTIVNYQLNYTPASLRNSALALSDAKMMQLDVM